MCETALQVVLLASVIAVPAWYIYRTRHYELRHSKAQRAALQAGAKE